jgi:hypothetical protein
VTATQIVTVVSVAEETQTPATVGTLDTVRIKWAQAKIVASAINAPLELATGIALLILYLGKALAIAMAPRW